MKAEINVSMIGKFYQNPETKTFLFLWINVTFLIECIQSDFFQKNFGKYNNQ